MPKFEYSPLHGEKGLEELEGLCPSCAGNIRGSATYTERRWLLRILLWAEHVALGVCLFTFLMLSTLWHLQPSTNAQCGIQLSAYTQKPLLDLAVSSYHIKQFNGSFSHTNKYKGLVSLSPPSKEVDDAWKVFQEVGAIRMTREEIEKLGKDPEISVQYPQEHGGGYMGYVESVHMIHCLDLIRKMTWRDHYADDIYFSDKPLMLRAHTDHCIDIIRQSLMCSADVGLFPYVWVEGISHPVPDFNSYHICRDFDAVLDWAKEAQVMDVQLEDLTTVGTRVLQFDPLGP